MNEIKCRHCGQILKQGNPPRAGYHPRAGYCLDCNKAFDAEMEKGSATRNRRAARQRQIRRTQHAARNTPCPWCAAGMRIESYIATGASSYLICDKCGSRGPGFETWEQLSDWLRTREPPAGS